MGLNNSDIRAALTAFDDDVTVDARLRLDQFDLFGILGISRAEIRHSSFLAWLMSPTECHSMNNCFLENLIGRFMQNPANYGKDYAFLSTIDMKNVLVTVKREYVNPDFDKRVRIDICVRIHESCGETIIAIENKIGAGERETENEGEVLKSGQLRDYQKLIETEYPHKEDRKVFVFLTPDGHLPEDEGDKSVWGCLSYEDVVQSVQAVQEKLGNRNDVRFKAETLFLLDNYIRCLRRCVVKDRELIKACKEVYSRHRMAIDCIVETMKSEENRSKELAKTSINLALEEIANDECNNIVLCKGRDANGTHPTFQTKTMNKYLPLMPEGKEGSWRNRGVYFYWFSIEYKEGEIGMKLCLEFGGKGLEEESDTVKRIQILFRKITGNDFEMFFSTGKKKGKPHIYHQTWEWKIMSGIRFDMDTQNARDDVKEWVRDAVKSTLEKEQELLRSAKNEYPSLFNE